MNKQLRILIAEDSEIDVKLLLRTLRAGGIDPVYETVETAESMQAALDAKPWDIVLSDYTMPQFDALAVLKIARRKDADLPVIIISGTIGEDVAVEAMRAGASDYFMKGHLVLLIPAIERELRDSAERRAHTQAEAALIESEAKYKTLYESARDALMTLFPPDWKFTSGNPATVGLFGAKDEADFASRAPWEVSPEYQPDGELSSVKAKRMIGMAMEKGSHFFEWTHKKIGGPDFPATVLLTRTALGGKTGLQATVRDVSAQKRAEAGVRGTYEMQGMLNAMLKRSLENVPLRDKLNSHLAALLAAPWLSVEAKGAVFLTGPGGRELVLTAHQALSPALLVVCAKVPFGRCLCGVAAATGQPAVSRSVEPDHHITYKGITPHGHYCAPIMAGGKVLGVLNLYLKEGGALTESQERFVKAAADVIAGNIIHSQVEDEFMQAQKIEAVGLLAGGVAHDFNNILTAIISYAEFVRRALPPGDPKAADMQEILTAADRAAALTRQLLAFGRRQIMAPQVVDLNRVVGGMTKLLSRLIGEDIKLTTKGYPFSSP